MALSSPATPVAGPIGTNRPIAVAVLEDEAHVRRMFESAIDADPSLQLSFSAQTVAQAKALAQTYAAQVYLVDLGLPDADGREFIRWVTENQPGAQVMVVTVFGDDEHIVSSFAAGAVGYLLKDAPADEIALHIGELVGGGSPISPSVARRMLQHFRTQHASLAGRAGQPAPEQLPEGQALSAREHEVLCLIEKGLTYEEVAQALGITWHTVTSYLRRVYRKLEVNSRSEAVFEARQRGML
jgi:DNA-binding NarL/FixJ family response regulator